MIFHTHLSIMVVFFFVFFGIPTKERNEAGQAGSVLSSVKPRV